MKTLVSYVRRPIGPFHHDFEKRNQFALAVMKEFKGRKAQTPVEKLVKSYINNQKVGVLMAIPDENGFVNITYAQWDNRMDLYDKGMMLDVAFERADRFTKRLAADDNWRPTQVPFEIAAALPTFMERARHYYKGATFPGWTYLYTIPGEVEKQNVLEDETPTEGC